MLKRNPIELLIGSRLKRNQLVTRVLRKGFGSFGEGSLIEWPFYPLSDMRDVHIGANVRLGPGTVIWVGPEGRVEIGDGSVFSGRLNLAVMSSVTIEAGVVFGWDVTVNDNRHVSDDPERPIVEQGLDDGRPIRVKRGAWAGNAAMVMPGVTIGRNAIVGANAVVTHDVPDFAVVAGVPARAIRG